MPGRRWPPRGNGLPRAGHALARHHAARAGLVVDHDRLAQAARHVLAHGAGGDVRRAAGRVGHHDADRLGRKWPLRPRAGRAANPRSNAGGDEQAATAHDALLAVGCDQFESKCAQNSTRFGE